MVPLLVLSAAVWASAIAASGQAQVNPLALVQRAVALQEANAAREKALAYRERVLNRDLDGDGQARSTREKVHDVLLIEGSPQRILLEEDGTSQSAEALAASRDFLRRVMDIRKAETERERRQRIEAYERKQREYRDAVSEIPRAFEFTLAGEEQVKGRLCYKLLATPRAGYQPRNRYGRIFTQTMGVIWIDKATGEWRRAEGELRETVNLGWIFVQVQKGTKAVAEQQEFPGQGWLMRSLWYRSVARVGFFMHYRREHRSEFWNYQAMTPALLASVLTDSYPQGGMQPDWRDSQ
ncbi:MAG: hypothetical protein KIT83_09965 [Bryobacterales bacterium]|nr:hypothetical protein [Bryobacterales bacterium]